MTYTFDIILAKRFGVNEAIMINNFAYWIAKNAANNKHFHDSRYWTYNSVAAMEVLFPFWTASQIRTIIQSLVKQGVILKGNYNERPYDRTVWYGFTDAFLKWMCENSQMDLSKLANGFAENSEPIPDNKPNNKPNKDKSTSPHFDFKKSIIEMGVSDQHAADWIAVRKAKRMTNTRTAFDRLKTQIEKACRQYGLTPDDCVAYAASKDWGGFDAGWDDVKNIKVSNGTNKDDRLRARIDAEYAKFSEPKHFGV